MYLSTATKISLKSISSNALISSLSSSGFSILSTFLFFFKDEIICSFFISFASSSFIISKGESISSCKEIIGKNIFRNSFF
jgi:hypothetical protein